VGRLFITQHGYFMVVWAAVEGGRSDLRGGMSGISFLGELQGPNTKRGE